MVLIASRIVVQSLQCEVVVFVACLIVVVACSRMNGGTMAAKYRFRSGLFRTVYERMLADEEHKRKDRSYWYEVEHGRLSEELCDKFLQLSMDSATQEFMNNCFEKADWVVMQLGHQMVKSVLGWFISTTSINGILSRGSMFVFSEEQFRDLLGVSASWKSEALLDLGAGDGMVTRRMADHFNEVYVTEVSTPMTWRLQEKGYTLLGLDEWSNGTRKYDVIACLNLLDRCDRPVKLLQQMRSVIQPDGFLLVASVIPFVPYVESVPDHKPAEYLLIEGRNFETQITNLVRHVFEPSGFQLLRYTRLPYLCEGDLHNSFYVLDDAIFVLKPH